MVRRAFAKTRVVAALLLVAALAVGVVLLVRSRSNGTPDPASDPTAAFELTRAALAATENLDSDQANQRWSEVLQLRGDDPDALRNAALTRVSTVEQTVAQLYDGSLSPAEKAAARERLPVALQQARAAIDAYAKQSEQPQLVSWMRAIVDIQEANQLPPAEQTLAHSEAFLKLADSIEQTAAPLILMGPLSELAVLLDDAVKGLPPEVASRYPDVLVNVSEKYPRNLFLAIETMLRLVKAQDPRALDQVDHVEQLTEPLAGLLERYATADRTFIDKQTAAIRDAIAADNWSLAAILAQQIRNVLTPTEIVRTDRKRANPNALDLLSFQGLRKLAAASAAEQSLATAKAPLQFQRQPTDSPLRATALCTVDFDLDGTPDIVSVFENQLTLTRRSSDAWEPYASTTIAEDTRGVIVTDLFMVDAGEPSRIRKPAAADLDTSEAAAASKRHETFPSAVVFGDSGIEIFRIDGRSDSDPDKRLLPPAAPSGLQDVTAVTGVQPGDLDGDGDLDLVVATADDGLRIWINRGNMTFFEVSQHSSLPPADDPVTAMSIGDIDRDLDLDILLTHGRSGRVAVLENLLHLQFRWKLLEGIEPLTDPALVSLEEIDGDASWDVVAAGAAGLQLAFTQTVDAGLVDVTQNTSLEQPTTASLLADLNNDSWLDWISIGEQATAAYSLGPWGQQPLPTESDLPAASTAIAACDLNGDGLLDLVGIADSEIWTALNTTVDPGHYIDVRFRGKNDNNENSGRINHYGIGTVLELRFGPHYRAQVITQRTTHFGIDGFDSVDTVRAILPNGITQNTVAPPVDTVLDEEQTLKGSCPYLYAWDGERFAFVTDCLWAAPLGLQLADGVVAPDRPWEYLKVPGRFVAPRDGQYEFRITEELWEAAYFDHVELTAVDHPADVEIFTNEKVGPGSIAEHTIFAFDPDTLRPTAAALDTQGRDVSATLADEDKTFVKGFDYRLRQGLCPPHWIDLDLGSVAADDKVLLVLTGWILPTDTSLNIQIDQNPALPAVQPPQVLVPDGDDWRVAIPFMGFPGGKTKTIVVDLSGHVNADDPRVRIRTSAQIYWDRAAVAINPPEQPLEQHVLKLQSAHLTWHGFSRRRSDGGDQPETYEYHEAESAPRWPPMRGPLSGYGDVLPLLTTWDDRMIVMGAGDEIQLRFSVPEKPLPEGWQRDFVLHSVGWDKDADLNTLTGQQFDPLPFRAMTAYPPVPAQAAEAAAVWQKNQHQLTRQQRFRAFWMRFP
ncbi:FG-GAP repeat domain-containing protein [Roseimaritima ulvae]|uniref:FG-GAP repeat protein n=1 Tax=Roseimaritima ulvae TaxID=980254 RepID=A0A5B9QHH8_9BACT|nr:VCBS repeat-containing protein [Roseimaritima ulvae]QEG38284.1 FG-GAP repeat protein [Roseimaritima ulvae]